MIKLILCSLVLSLPVWGWAGEPKEVRWCFNESTNDVYPCPEWPAPGIWRGPKDLILKQWQEKQPCYQRMREAMTAMDSAPLEISPRKHRMLFNMDRSEPTLVETLKLMYQWEQTMGDCVKGRH